MENLNDLKNAYQSAHYYAESGGINSGFSQRFNDLISSTYLKAPELNKGRGAWLAKLSNSSKPTTSDWLLHDKPPQSIRLRALVIFLADYLPEKDKNVPMLEAWVLYGDGESWLESK
jgi:hypothetical protein